ncbi:uncharacterized protein LOC18780826 [Prunus persica]|uniref:uncharacterized protein LOC18780826 n=1 Tax=Prunus persica TaxID=3760 RepID=UPI0009AB208D|nr:uncharacterized protein LOC18780826 [Prunus persica]XP_020418547.1 uncharacterized protein LOC18780826 [Prunus persica]
MLLAIAAVLISIWELTAYQIVHSGVFFGTLPDIYGLVAGISHCICCIVQYVYCLRHGNNPFKASLLPAIFLLCLGGSKLSNNRRNANTTDNILRKPLDGGKPLGCAGLPLYTLALFMLLTFWVAMKGLHQSQFLSLWMSKSHLGHVRSHLQVEGNMVTGEGVVVGGWEVLADDGHVGGGWDEVMAEQQQLSVATADALGSGGWLEGGLTEVDMWLDFEVVALCVILIFFNYIIVKLSTTFWLLALC